MRTLLVCFLLLVLSTALLSGMAMVFEPDGDVLGFSTDLLTDTPFSNFLIPGLLLATVFGGGYLIALLLILVESEQALNFTLLMGILLILWMAVQMMLVPYYTWLQGVYLVVGFFVFLLSYHLKGKAAF